MQGELMKKIEEVSKVEEVMVSDLIKSETFRITAKYQTPLVHYLQKKLLQMIRSKIYHLSLVLIYLCIVRL